LSDLKFLAVLETDDEIGQDRLVDRHCRLQRFGRRSAHSGGNAFQRGMDLADQPRQFAGRDGIVRHVGRDDVGGESEEAIGSGFSVTGNSLRRTNSRQM
jgi:hypothetical protein